MDQALRYFFALAALISHCQRTIETRAPSSRMTVSPSLMYIGPMPGRSRCVRNRRLLQDILICRTKFSARKSCCAVQRLLLAGGALWSCTRAVKQIPVLTLQSLWQPEKQSRYRLKSFECGLLGESVRRRPLNCSKLSKTRHGDLHRFGNTCRGCSDSMEQCYMISVDEAYEGKNLGLITPMP